MHQLEGLGPVVQPGALREGEREGVDGRHQEVETEGPEGEKGEEAERLSDGGLALLDLIRADIDILQADGCCVVREPGVGDDDGSEAVHAKDGADARKDKRRDEVRGDEGFRRVEEAGCGNAPSLVGEELHIFGEVDDDVWQGGDTGQGCYNLI